VPSVVGEKTNGQDGSSSLIGISFAKLDVRNLWLWATTTTDYVKQDGLWNLVNGHEELPEKPEKHKSDKDTLVKEHENNIEKYE